ncbi:hypothetical protein [Haloarchaeobius sp. TZWWS8]|uniref:hypothetical protein n=1 Tax=Haloarchaeobius sp. TZWWS8 TaxID=3446121 RepID=UPI003EB839CA
MVEDSTSLDEAADDVTEGEDHGRSTELGWTDLLVAVVAAGAYLLAREPLGLLGALGLAVVAGFAVGGVLAYSNFK